VALADHVANPTEQSFAISRFHFVKAYPHPAPALPSPAERGRELTTSIPAERGWFIAVNSELG
jgi:hypothetical protein